MTQTRPRSALHLRTTLLATALVASLALFSPLAAAGTTYHPAQDSEHPAALTWSNGVINLTFGGEEPSFYVSSTQDGRVNVSVQANALAEVAPNGNVVALAALTEATSAWTHNWSATSNGVEVNLSGSVPVGPVSVPWNSSELPDSSEGTMGSVAVVLTFHLFQSSSGSPWSVKFDVSAHGWPWASVNDSLGLGLRVQAADATEIESSSGADGITEGSNATGSPVANLTWAPTATVTTASGSTATATVVPSVLVSDDHQNSEVHLLFSGVQGGYSALFYDPTISLHSGAFSRSSPMAWLFTPEVLGAIVGGTILVALLAATAWKARSEPSTDQLSPSTPAWSGRVTTHDPLLCHRCGSRLRIPRGDGVRILTCMTCSKI